MVASGGVERFGVYLISLDPTVGSEINKTRPCVIVSPDELNRNIRTAIVAPMTTTQKRYPSRVPCSFGGKTGDIALDQIRTVDQSRLIRRLGRLTPATAKAVVDALQNLFSP